MASPDEGFSSPGSMSQDVNFHASEGPTIATFSPGFIENEILLTLECQILEN